jgi:hypothetical protein
MFETTVAIQTQRKMPMESGDHALCATFAGPSAVALFVGASMAQNAKQSQP